MEASRFGSYLLVDLNKLKSNIEALREEYSQNKILFMVKADGYGHGLVEIVKFAFEKMDVKEFGVATLGEAMTLRKHLPTLAFEIFVFSDLQFQKKDLAEFYLENRLIPVISHTEDLKTILEDSQFANIPLCLKFNTGMNRLGFGLDQVDEVISQLKSHGRTNVFHLMSHFANASMPMDKNNRNIWQHERFDEVKQKLSSSGIKVESTSLANSGALEQGFCKEETHIRPGLMLYGPTSLAPQHLERSWWKGQVISQLKTTVISSFEVKKGDPLGYNSIPAPEEGVVAIIAMGYGDGISTRYKGATLYHKGVPGKICAKVCMDMTYILFPVGTKVERGEEFTIWDGDSDKFMQLSHETQTIPYELVIQLTTRVPRIYQLD